MTRADTSEIKTSQHALHLYTSEVDRYQIHRAYLLSSKKDEEVVVVSSDDPRTIKLELGFTEGRLKILAPTELHDKDMAPTEGTSSCLIVDASSFSSQSDMKINRRESYLNRVVEKNSMRCLCTYKISDLSGAMIKHLAKVHDRLALTTGDLTLISGRFMEKPAVPDESIRKMVRDSLEAIILALIQKRKVTGLDIIQTIHLEFNVLLSPGAVYPLLSSLQERGLLTSSREGKERRYAPTQESRLEIERFVHQEIDGRRIMSSYLENKLARLSSR